MKITKSMLKEFNECIKDWRPSTFDEDNDKKLLETYKQDRKELRKVKNKNRDKKKEKFCMKDTINIV